MTAFRRLPAGGRIDRGKPVTAQFNGKALTGFDGDTLASALLANNIPVIGRSFKYHRPRGILSAGVEEPNALFTLGETARTEPNIPATMTDDEPATDQASDSCDASRSSRRNSCNDEVEIS